MSTAKKAKQVVSTTNIAQQVKGASDSLKKATNESGFQQGIERMQLALKTNQFAAEPRLKRANAALDAVTKRDNEMRKQNVIALSNYKPLADIYNNELKQLTADIFEAEAGIQARKFLGKAKSTVTPEQEEVVVQYYLAKSTVSIDKIAQIRNLLVAKGQIKDEAKNAKLPTPVPSDKAFQEAMKAAV